MKLSRKILTALIALPLSAFTILLVYSFMYLFLGEEVYVAQMEILRDFSVLLKEFLVIAIAMFIAIIAYQISYEKILEKERKILAKVICMIALIVCFAFLPIILAYYLLADLGTFCSVFIILWVTFVTIFSLIMAIKDFVDVWIVNKKLRGLWK